MDMGATCTFQDLMERHAVPIGTLNVLLDCSSPTNQHLGFA